MFFSLQPLPRYEGHKYYFRHVTVADNFEHQCKVVSGVCADLHGLFLSQFDTALAMLEKTACPKKSLSL